jgi:hypothetical protein
MTGDVSVPKEDLNKKHTEWRDCMVVLSEKEKKKESRVRGWCGGVGRGV